MNKDLVERRLSLNASLKKATPGAKARLVNTVVSDFEKLKAKDERFAWRVWNRVEFKITCRDFSIGKSEVAVWKSLFCGIRREIIIENIY
jgi:hypothetical protein